MLKPCCNVSPKSASAISSSARGRGLRAITSIEIGEVVAVFGGVSMDTAAYRALPLEQARLGLQVDDNHYLVSRVEGEGDWINHSCEPNLGFRGQIVLVALRPIEANEELSFDYAMSDGSDCDEFICHCGSRRCRGRVTGNDWRDSTLWTRYEGYFSPYLSRRIAMLRWSRLEIEGGDTSAPSNDQRENSKWSPYD